MNAENPIPQIIIVGILRVLLTTCPNNNANKTGSSGGVELHSEWSSCLDLLNEERQVFVNSEYKEVLETIPQDK
jgi:hypothetical protein